MNVAETTQDTHLKAQAREWLVRLNSGRAREEDHRAAAAWRAQSPSHETAYRDIEQLWTQLAQLGPTADAVNTRLTAPERIQVPSSAQRPYRKRLAAAALIVAAICGWSATPPGGAIALFADVRTTPGQQHTFDLEDGSRVTLNGASALNWDATAHERHVHLISGDAYFEVAKDSTRPFIVTTGNARVRVTGTAFVIKQLDDSTSLEVVEGRVLASATSHPDEVPVTHGQALNITSTLTDAPRALDPEEATLWMRGRLVFREVTLPDIAAELARYRSRNILVIGERARHVRITGVFDSSDPDRILDVIARTQGLRIREAAPLFTVIY